MKSILHSMRIPSCYVLTLSFFCLALTCTAQNWGFLFPYYATVSFVEKAPGSDLFVQFDTYQDSVPYADTVMVWQGPDFPRDQKYILAQLDPKTGKVLHYLPLARWVSNLSAHPDNSISFMILNYRKDSLTELFGQPIELPRGKADSYYVTLKLNEPENARIRKYSNGPTLNFTWEEGFLLTSRVKDTIIVGNDTLYYSEKNSGYSPMLIATDTAFHVQWAHRFFIPDYTTEPCRNSFYFKVSDVDKAGNVYISASLLGEVYMDDTLLYTSANHCEQFTGDHDDFVILKFSPTGELLLKKKIGSQYLGNLGGSVYHDNNSGKILVQGATGQTKQYFDTITAHFPENPPSGVRSFTATIDTTGMFDSVWVHSCGIWGGALKTNNKGQRAKLVEKVIGHELCLSNKDTQYPVNPEANYLVAVYEGIWDLVKYQEFSFRDGYTFGGTVDHFDDEGYVYLEASNISESFTFMGKEYVVEPSPTFNNKSFLTRFKPEKLPLSLHEKNQVEAGITVYPNPMLGNTLHIESKFPLAQVDVYTIEGRKLASEFTASGQVILKQSAPGVLLVKVTGKSGFQKTVRVLKM